MANFSGKNTMTSKDHRFLRQLEWRRQHMAVALAFDFNRIHRLAHISEIQSMEYAWDSYVQWKILEKYKYAEQISTEITLAPFSLEFSTYCLRECCFRRVNTHFLRRITCEIMVKISLISQDIGIGRQALLTCKVASLVANFLENKLPKSDYLEKLHCCAEEMEPIAWFVIDILYDQQKILGRENIAPYCHLLLTRYFSGHVSTQQAAALKKIYIMIE